MRDNYCYESCVNGHCPLIIEEERYGVRSSTCDDYCGHGFLDVILVGFQAMLLFVVIVFMNIMMILNQKMEDVDMLNNNFVSASNLVIDKLYLVYDFLV